MLQRATDWLAERRRARVVSGGGLGISRVTVVLLAVLALTLLAVWWGLAALAPADDLTTLRIDQLRELAADGRVDAAEFRDEDAQIVATIAAGSTPPAGDYAIAYPKSDAATNALLEDLGEGGADVSVDPQSGKAVIRILVTVLLPLVVLADLFALLLTWSRGDSGGLGEVQHFGRIGDRKVAKGQQEVVGFDDVGGAEEAVIELREVVDYLTNPDRYRDLGATAPKGVLLFGPPGCGKTLLAKAVAGEAGVPFFSVAGAEFVESLVGVGAARVRDLFAKVRAAAPAIVFIDEIDAAGRKRGAGGSSGGSDEREQTLNQLLVEMDGFAASSGIVVMGATNRPDILDPALLRPGRFDRHVTIERPDLASRERILRLHADRRTRVATDVDFTDLARRTPGFTGADLENVVNEAALLTIRESADTIGIPMFNEAILRVMGGPRRRGHVMTDDERRRIAAHESAHAVVAAALGRREDVHRVSLVARGAAAGATAVTDGRDGAVQTRTMLHQRLVLTMAGAMGEELVTGEASTAAEDDLGHATDLATDMVARYGMSDAVGRRRLVGDDVDVFLGGGVELDALSPELRARLDDEVDRLLGEAADTARGLLEQHRDVLDRLCDLLVEHETLEGAALHRELPTADRPAPTGRRSRTARAGASA